MSRRRWRLGMRGNLARDDRGSALAGVSHTELRPRPSGGVRQIRKGDDLTTLYHLGARRRSPDVAIRDADLVGRARHERVQAEHSGTRNISAASLEAPEDA